MAEKQSILGRIAQLTRANVNALLDRAEDPEKMLNQLVRDYTASISEARDAVAQTIGNLRLAEKDHAADIAEARDWGNKALAPPGRPINCAPAGTRSAPTSGTRWPRSPSPSRSRLRTRPKRPSR